MSGSVCEQKRRTSASVCLSVCETSDVLVISVCSRPFVPVSSPGPVCGVCVFVGCFFFCSDGYACRSKKQEESGGSVVFVAKGQECRRFLGKREEAL